MTIQTWDQWLLRVLLEYDGVADAFSVWLERDECGDVIYRLE